MQLSQSAHKTVLLAEDDVLMRMPLAEYLRGCGYKVIEAISAEEAIELLDDGGDAISLVISSVELAGDGFGIAKWLRQHRPDLEIRLSGTIRRAVDLAAALCQDGPLPAPYHAQLLHRYILRLMARRTSPGQEGRQVS